MSSLLDQPIPPPIGHFCRFLVILIFVIRRFRDNTFLEEDKTIILQPSKQKSDHYSLRNRENEKHNFAGGPVREGGNASLVVGVTRAVYERVHPRIYAFCFRNFEG